MREPGPRLAFDRDVPLVVVKVGHYPVHHGSVAAIRSLGRVGVPVYAITEDLLTPVAASRYLRGRFVWSTTGTEGRDALVEGLAAVGRRLPHRSVALPTDDEAAVLLAEHKAKLAEWFLIPPVNLALPGMLASKRGLHELCHRHGVPTAKAAFPSGPDDVESYATKATFPVVVKNVDPWIRLRDAAVSSTTIVATADDLLLQAKSWPPRSTVMLQEYIPQAEAEDWIFHGYFNHRSERLVAFTGVKIRSWPPHAGVTTYAYTLGNDALVDLASDFCRRIGYTGIVDLDWRFDRRDGRYKLLDFNPRVGAQFRLFQNQAGIDVVRALHLDMTGRQVPSADQIDGRKLIVEHLDVPARMAYRREVNPWSPKRVAGPTELAWTAADDPFPLLLMTLRFGWCVVGRLGRPLGLPIQRRWRRLRARPPAVRPFSKLFNPRKDGGSFRT